MNNDRFKFRYWDIWNEHMTYSHKAKDLAEFFMWYTEVTKAGNGTVLMQFTGLKDCEGKNVYEGDVVEFITNNGRGYISFENGFYHVNFENTNLNIFTLYKFFKVIGNIYENKNLLEEKR